MNILKSKETQEYLEKPLLYKHIKINTLEIDIQMLYKAEKIMAQIVKKYSNQYLPAFIRINKEIEKRKAEYSYEVIALQIANDNSL